MAQKGFLSLRVAVEAGAFEVDLEGRYRHLRVWLDAGSSPVRVNPTEDATDAMAQCDDGREASFYIAEGVEMLYLFGDGAVGFLNVEAWA